MNINVYKLMMEEQKLICFIHGLDSWENRYTREYDKDSKSLIYDKILTRDLRGDGIYVLDNDLIIERDYGHNHAFIVVNVNKLLIGERDEMFNMLLKEHIGDNAVVMNRSGILDVVKSTGDLNWSEIIDSADLKREIRHLSAEGIAADGKRGELILYKDRFIFVLGLVPIKKAIYFLLAVRSVSEIDSYCRRSQEYGRIIVKDSRILLCDEIALDLLKISTDDVSGQDLSYIFDGRTVVDINAALTKSEESEECIDYSIIAVSKIHDEVFLLNIRYIRDNAYYIFQIRRVKSKERLIDQSGVENEIFKNFFIDLPVPVQIFDIMGNVTEANKACYKFWNIPYLHEDVLRYNIYNDEQLKSLGVIEKFDEAKNGHQVSIADIQYDPKLSGNAGERRVLQAILFFIKDSESELNKIGMFIHDLTELKSKERAIREAKMSLQITLNSIGDGVIVTDDRGHIQRVNPMVLTLTDCMDEELLGNDINEVLNLFNIDELKIIKLDIMEIFNQEILYRTGKQMALMSRTGQVRFIELSINILRTEENEKQGLVIVIKDITRKYENERKLKESEREFRTLVENMPGAVFKCYMDKDLTLKYISDNIAEISGYGASYFYENNYMEELLLEEDREKRKNVYRALKAKENYKLEYRMKSKNGEIRWILERGRLSNYDKEYLLEGVMFDISERKKYEFDLATSQDKFRRLAENSPDIIFSYRQDDERFEYLSTAIEEITGYSAEEIYQDHELLSKILHKDWYEYYSKEMQKLSKEMRTSRFEFKIVSRSGQVKWLLQKSMFVEQKDGSGLVEGLISDISDRKEAVKELAISEMKYRRLYQGMVEGVAILDKAGNIQECNKSLNKILGYEDRELQGINISALSRGKLLSSGGLLDLNKLYETGYASLDEWVLLSKSGEEIIAELGAYILTDEENAPSGVFIIIRDMTAARRAEKALQLSEEKLIQAMRATNDGLWLYDVQHESLELSDRIYEMLEFGARGDDNDKERLKSNLYEEEWNKLLTAVKDHVSGKIANINLELRVNDNLWILVRGNTVERDEHGNIVEILGTATDITDLRKTEVALLASQQKLKLHLKQTPLAVVEWYKDIIISDWNKSAENIYGYSRQEMLEKSPIGSIIGDNQREEFTEKWMSMLDSKQPKDFRLENRTKSGDLIICDWYNTVLLDINNDIVGVASMIMDVTDRVKSEEDIMQMNKTLEDRVEERTSRLSIVNKELKDFAYIVSHDLKAPLRGINQLVQWIKADYSGAIDQDGIEMMDLLTDRVKRMNTLIDGVLQYSRIGRMNTDSEEIDLNVLVAETIDLLSFEDKVIVEIAEKLPVVEGDRVMYGQLFQNLISNAVKYNDKDEKRVDIAFEDGADFYLFRIQDNGPGIAEKFHERIFGIFQTVHNRENVDSTGIGLTIVKKIVDLYGGKIWVDSEEGQGASFNFTIKKITG